MKRWSKANGNDYLASNYKLQGNKNPRMAPNEEDIEINDGVREYLRNKQAPLMKFKVPKVEPIIKLFQSTL